MMATDTTNIAGIDAASKRKDYAGLSDTPTKRVNTTTLEGIKAASNPDAPSYVPENVNTNTLEGILAASGITGPTGPTGPATPKSPTGPTNPVTPGSGIDDTEMANRRSAYQLLLDEFTKYGLASLVTDAKDLLLNRTPSQEIPLALRNTDAYQKRFSANKDRRAAGLREISPAEYIAKEDAYQNLMRNYGLPAEYYTKDATGKQIGFDKLIAADVDDVELEDRIATAQQRVLNTNPEVLKALKQFYPDLNNADILAYTLDPKNALQNIKRKVTAAEIGGAALQQGLQAQGGTAESLAGQGVTKAQAQQGYATVAELTPRGSELASIYGETPYTQQTAEAEVFNTAGAAEAARKRKKLAGLETAQFSGSSGVGALGRDRANPYGTSQSGYGQY